jgi:hypothetical protein
VRKPQAASHKGYYTSFTPPLKLAASSWWLIYFILYPINLLDMHLLPYAYLELTQEHSAVTINKVIIKYVV